MLRRLQNRRSHLKIMYSYCGIVTHQNFVRRYHYVPIDLCFFFSLSTLQSKLLRLRKKVRELNGSGQMRGEKKLMAECRSGADRNFEVYIVNIAQSHARTKQRSLEIEMQRK